MTIYWPDDLPYLEVMKSLQVDPRDEAARSSFDQGPGRVRNRYTQALTVVSFVLNPLSDEEFESFKSFYRDTLHNGTRWFRMRLWSSGYVGYDVQFTQKYQAGDYDVPNYWQVSLSLVVRDYQLERTQTDIFVGSQWDPSDPNADAMFVGLTNQLHDFLYTTWPAIAGRT